MGGLTIRRHSMTAKGKRGEGMTYRLYETLVNLQMRTRAVFIPEEGQGLVEYGLIIALVSLAAIVGLGILGGALNTLFSELAAKV
jgi:pilus assembly protein Flp/PilA